MKQGPLLNRILMLALFAALLIYLGVYVWDSMNDPFTTATAYACTVDDAMEATGFLVREEQVIQGNGAVVDQLFNEGEKVARGQTVAVLYGSAEAAERRGTLLALENERDQLQYALTQSADAGDNARLSGEIIDAITTLRSSVASEDFTRLEDQALELKSLILPAGRRLRHGGRGGRHRGRDAKPHPGAQRPDQRPPVPVQPGHHPRHGQPVGDLFGHGGRL